GLCPLQRQPHSRLARSPLSSPRPRVSPSSSRVPPRTRRRAARLPALPDRAPRALDGFVDTLSEVSGFDLEHPLLVRLYNPVAAMPSLHVAFAVVTGVAIAEESESGATRAFGYA